MATPNAPRGTGDAAIDPAELALALRVIEQTELLPPEHPDAVAVRRATARIFKGVRNARRAERRDAISSADRAVVAATATGSPQRIDDETEGLPLVSSAAGASAGVFVRPRPCYICKQDYVQVDAFYHQLCPTCAAENRAPREGRTHLTRRRARLPGAP